MSDGEANPRVSLGWRALLRMVRLLPQGILSRAWGWLARRRLPAKLQSLVNASFVRLAGIDSSEAEAPPRHYPTLAAYFVRRLRPGIRAWPDDPAVPGSPVDGVLGTFGRLEDGTLLQAKGIGYSAADLLADPDAARWFEDGVFFTLYLSPRHYHRVHAPVRSELRSARAVPGRLLPVNAAAVRSIPDLFPRNERLVTLHDCGDAKMAVVAVGAYNVGSISTEFDPSWQRTLPAGVTNRGLREELRSYDPPLSIQRAAELMAFHFGSTVVLLLSGSRDSRPPLHPGLRQGSEIPLGTPLLAGPLA